LSGLKFPTRIGLGQIDPADNAKRVVGVVMSLLHPRRDIAASVDLPFMDVRNVAELFQLLADPESPIPVAAGIADEDIGHASPSHRPLAHANITAEHNRSASSAHLEWLPRWCLAASGHGHTAQNPSAPHQLSHRSNPRLRAAPPLAEPPVHLLGLPHQEFGEPDPSGLDDLLIEGSNECVQRGVVERLEDPLAVLDPRVLK